MLWLRKSKKGFTLIELMVVVAIIGVLALLGLRMYTGQQDKAKNAIIKANAGTIQTLIQAELADSSSEDVCDNVAAAADGGTLGPDSNWNLFQASGIFNPIINEAQVANDGGSTKGDVYVVAYDADGIASLSCATSAYFQINGTGADGDDVYTPPLTARR